MEDTNIINAVKDAKKDKYVILDNNREPNHTSPMKPIDEVNRKVDALTVEIRSLKKDIKIILDTIKSKKTQTEYYTEKGWFW